MSFLAQPPPACAPRKQLVQVKTGTGTPGALIGRSAASAQDAILDSEITTVARSDSLIVESFVRLPTLHGEPDMEEQRVVVAGARHRAVELVVPGVLESYARVGPRPPRRLADAEWDVGDLGRKPV